MGHDVLVTWRFGSPEVMISYARAGRPGVATQLHDRLTGLGWAPRLDAVDIDEGTRWRGAIHGWLDSCDMAVVLLCPLALQSPWVLDELSILAHRFFKSGSDLEALMLARFDPVSLDSLATGRLAAAQASELQSRLQFADSDPDEMVVDQLVEELLKFRPQDLPRSNIHHRAVHHARGMLPTARPLLERVTGAVGTLRHSPPDDDDLLMLAAVELCRTDKPFDGIAPIMNGLADNDVYDLVDLNTFAVFDGRICDDLAGPAAALVLACGDPVAAELSIRAAFTASSTRPMNQQVIVHHRVQPFEGDALQQATAIADAILLGIAAEYNDDPREVLGTRQDSDDRIVAIVQVEPAAVALLSAAAITLAAEMLGGNALVVYVNADPVVLSRQLGLPLVGPDDPAVLSQYADVAARAVIQRGALHSRFRQELARQPGKRR